MPMFGQYRLGMKLHPFDIQGFMPDAHDFIEVALFVLSPGRDFKAIGQGRLFDDQGVIARGGKGVTQTFKHADIMVVYLGGFAMHDAFRMDNIAAEGIAYTLMAQTDAEDRKLSGEL